MWVKTKAQGESHSSLALTSLRSEGSYWQHFFGVKANFLHMLSTCSSTMMRLEKFETENLEILIMRNLSTSVFRNNESAGGIAIQTQ
jgi:hypothetical protein